MEQIWQLAGDGGTLYTCGVGFPAGSAITVPVQSFTDNDKVHYATTNGMSRPVRDIPRNVSLIERGLFNAKTIMTSTTPIEGLKDAYRAVVEYTTIAGVMRPRA
jgi:Zn-dependent alcohol dehydrogenase